MWPLVFQVMHMKICIHYSTRNLLASYKVCFYCNIRLNPVLYGCLIWLVLQNFALIYLSITKHMYFFETDSAYVVAYTYSYTLHTGVYCS